MPLNIKFKSIKRITYLTVITVALTACGGGGGSSDPEPINSENEESEKTAIRATQNRFDADVYTSESVDNSSLTGTWLLTGEYSIEDTYDNEIDEIQFREIVNLKEAEGSIIEIADCFQDLGGTKKDEVSDNELSWLLSFGTEIKLSIANNTRLEGVIQSSGDSSMIVSSTAPTTMVKVSDHTTDFSDPSISLGSTSLNLMGDGINGGELNFDGEIACFAEKEVTRTSLPGSESPGDLSYNHLTILSNKEKGLIYVDILSAREGSQAGNRDNIVETFALSEKTSINIHYYDAQTPTSGHYSNEVIASTITFLENSESAIIADFTIDAEDTTLGSLDISGEFSVDMSF